MSKMRTPDVYMLASKCKDGMRLMYIEKYEHTAASLKLLREEKQDLGEKLKMDS